MHPRQRLSCARRPPPSPALERGAPGPQNLQVEKTWGGGRKYSKVFQSFQLVSFHKLSILVPVASCAPADRAPQSARGVCSSTWASACRSALTTRKAGGRRRTACRRSLRTCHTRPSARATSWGARRTGRRRASASSADVRRPRRCGTPRVEPSLAARGFRVRRARLTPPAAARRAARYQGGGGVNTVFNFFAQDEARSARRQPLGGRCHTLLTLLWFWRSRARAARRAGGVVPPGG